MPLRYELILPELGAEGEPVTVSLWLVDLGSEVSEGEPIVEVLLGAAVVDLPAPADGVLVERFVEEDDRVDVGQVLGIVEAEDEPFDE